MKEDTGTFEARCVTRVAGPPDVAFDAWMNPDLLAGWMRMRESGGDGTPRLVDVEDVEIAPEPGATFRLTMITREADGSRRLWPHEGEVVEANRPGKLALTWSSEGTGHRPTLLEIEFVSMEDDTTELRLRHGGFIDEAAAREHAEGWDILLELFSEAVLSAVSMGVKLTAARLKEHLRVTREGAAE